MNEWEILLGVTIVFSMVYGVDDLFIDFTYWAYSLRRYFSRRKRASLTINQLLEKPEQRVAILVPCWMEKDVVGESLRNTIYSLQYELFDVFVGTYPNDPDTLRVVRDLMSDMEHLHYVVCPNPGPTSKADNLNSLIRGIKQYEKSKNIHYDILVLHDAEDIVHPLSLKLYNYLIPEKDMVQIPVFPLDVPLTMFTHWTYADEFAENHTKDILSREILGGFVPSAGVGTAFSRQAVDKVTAETTSELEGAFSTKTLTEDYAFSLELKKKKLKSIFVHQAFEHVTQERRWKVFGPMMARKKKEWIATRALFPVNYAASIRQKSRWILGISLQEWKESGWLGNLATRYTLYRDRKGPLGHIICLVGYFFFFIFISGWISQKLNFSLAFLPQPSTENHFIWTLLLINAVFMCHRILQRFIAVARIYGIAPAFLSPLRIIYGNFLNAHAFGMALLRFISSVKTGRRPSWSKTSNVFPTAEQLIHYRRRLGDLLLDSARVTPAQLQRALVQQSRSKKRLGAILIEEGIVTEEEVTQCLAKLYAMKIINLDEYLLKFTIADLPTLPENIQHWLRKRRLVPVQENEGKLYIALADPSDQRLKKDVLEKLPEQQIRFVVAPSEQIDRAVTPR